MASRSAAKRLELEQISSVQNAMNYVCNECELSCASAITAMRDRMRDREAEGGRADSDFLSLEVPEVAED